MKYIHSVQSTEPEKKTEKIFGLKFFYIFGLWPTRQMNKYKKNIPKKKEVVKIF